MIHTRPAIIVVSRVSGMVAETVYFEVVALLRSSLSGLWTCGASLRNKK